MTFEEFAAPVPTPVAAEPPPPAEPEPEPPRRPAVSGPAYITVTDAAGRVLFRRAATAEEVEDALRSAEEADRQGQAAMDRISYQRQYDDLHRESSRHQP